MNFILACVCILAILPVNACHHIKLWDGVTINAPYYFGYNSTRDTMLATFYLDINLSSDVEVYLVYSVHQGERGYLIKARRRIDPSGYTVKGEAEPRQTYSYHCQLRLTDKQILLSVMFAANVSCDPVTIFEGIAIDRNSTDPGYKYDSRCLRSKPCLIYVNGQLHCPETTETAVTADKPQTVQACGAETSTLAIVMSTLFSIVFIALVSIVICICCIKINSQGTPGDTNRFQPFYVNMLFRRECDQELAEIDRHYEEIDPRLGEGSRHA